jgi:predicted CoA-substrate-specific enzyme activase
MGDKIIFAGIDAGSRTIKVVLFDDRNRDIAGTGITDQGVKQEQIAGQLFNEVLEKSGLEQGDISFTVATGYGRNALTWIDTTITEITCHARGVSHELPEARTVIDIGGQDSKLIRLEKRAKVRDFAMNDRCAAGTGRFLEVVAQRLDIGLKDLGNAADKADKPSLINSTCVVFAETEITGLLATGHSPANIAAGVQNSIASRIKTMAGNNLEQPVIFTGGVALIPGMDQALAKCLDLPIKISPNPQFTGALGAALLASQRNK